MGRIILFFLCVAVIIAILVVCEHFAKENSAARRLDQMDKSNPERRGGMNADDYWLQRNANRLCKNVKALDIINNYGYLTDTFFRGLTDADKDIVFQKHIIKIESGLLVYYRGILWHYLKRWDFAPEIKEIVFNDDKYAPVVRIYTMLRDSQTGELLASSV